MALPSNFPITLQQINAEFGGSGLYGYRNQTLGGRLISGSPAMSEFFGLTSTPPPGLSTSWNGARVAFERSGGTAIATAAFRANGTCTGGGVATAAEDSLTGKNWWSAAPVAGIGASYWLKCTPTSGTLNSNDAVAWMQMNIDLFMGVQQATFGNKTCTFRADIAASAGGAILATGFITLEVERM